jgi:hypothetical protein
VLASIPLVARTPCRAEEKERNEEAAHLAHRRATPTGAIIYQFCSVAVRLPCSGSRRAPVLELELEANHQRPGSPKQGPFTNRHSFPGLASPGVVCCVLCVVCCECCVLFPAPQSQSPTPKAPAAPAGARSTQQEGRGPGIAQPTRGQGPGGAGRPPPTGPFRGKAACQACAGGGVTRAGRLALLAA